MSPTFHPSERLLAAYADGALPLAPGLTVSAHLEGCAICRARVQDAEQAEADRLIVAEPVDLSPDALAIALDQLSTEAPALPQSTTSPAMIGDVELPGAVARLGLRKRRYLAPGLWAARVDLEVFDDWRAVVLRIPPGIGVPPHGHSSDELIAVLSGAFSDEQVYSAGDFSESGASRNHDLKAVGDAPCVCLIAIRGRLVWKGWSQVVGLALDL